MSTRSLTRIFDESGAELLCLYRHCDGYPSGMGEDLAKACDVRIVNGMGDDGLDQANGMGCLAARIVATLKVEWKNPFSGIKVKSLETLAKRKAPYINPGNVNIVPVGTTGCWEEYEYHVKFRKVEEAEGVKREERRNGEVVLSCYSVEGGYDEKPRELVPLAVDVRPKEFLEAANKGQEQLNMRRSAEYLHEDLKDKPWFLSVGVGAKELIVMAKTKPPAGEVPEEHDDFKVKLRVVGDIHPA